jgi:hypothetical protein
MPIVGMLSSFKNQYKHNKGRDKWREGRRMEQ